MSRHIFEAFVPVGKTSARSGTGLGLAITRQFVKLMGGTIQLESRLGESGWTCGCRAWTVQRQPGRSVRWKTDWR